MKRKKRIFIILAISAVFLSLGEQKNIYAQKEEVKIDTEKEIKELTKLSQSYEYEKSDDYQKVLRDYPLVF